MTTENASGSFGNLPHASPATPVAQAGHAPQSGPPTASAPALRTVLFVTIPKDLLGDEWPASGFTDEFLTFGSVGLTPLEEKRALSLAPPGDVMASVKGLADASVYALAGRKTNHLEREKWLKAIGPIARSLVDSAFNKKNSLDNDVGEQVLAAAVPGVI